MSTASLKLTLAAAATVTIVLSLLFLALRSASSTPTLEIKVPDAPSHDGVLKVYISGAVARPGVYQAQPGDRYADALALAGGPIEDADPLGVNLARRVRDEDHIHVPRRGEPPLTLASGEPVLDLNTATVKQLEELPGIGPARAQKIVESRTKEGAFTGPDDLVLRKLIPLSTLEPIRARLQVRP